jgi:hypothetical protein
MPTMVNSRQAVLAFNRVVSAIRSNSPVKNLTSEAKRAFDFVISTKMKPIRLLYDVKISDIKPTDNGIDKQTYHIGEITIHAMEMSLIPATGPDNVSTESWSVR